MPRRAIRYALGVAWFGLVTAGSAHAVPFLVQTWRDLSPKERYDALQNYRQHERLPAERQRDIEQRYEQWRSLPQDERDRVRRNYERYKQMPPRDRERFERKYEKWKRRGDGR